MCLNCKFFPDEIDANQDMVDSMMYSLSRNIKSLNNAGIWKRVEAEGVGDNNGFYELEITNNTNN